MWLISTQKNWWQWLLSRRPPHSISPPNMSSDARICTKYVSDPWQSVQRIAFAPFTPHLARHWRHTHMQIMSVIKENDTKEISQSIFICIRQPVTRPINIKTHTQHSTQFTTQRDEKRDNWNWNEISAAEYHTNIFQRFPQMPTRKSQYTQECTDPHQQCLAAHDLDLWFF